MFITITSLFREAKLITILIINIIQQQKCYSSSTSRAMYHSFLWDLSPLNLASSLKGCIPTPKPLSSLKLKLYDYKCFYLLNDDFGGKFQNPFSPKLFTEIFGDLIKKPTEHLFTENIFTENFRS